MDTQFPQRKRTRWEGFDYNSAGAYFITICTQNRQQLLSHIVGGDVMPQAATTPDSVGSDVMPQAATAPRSVLLYHGTIADKYLKQLSEFYDYMEVDQYVIMPNHIHFILFVYETDSNKLSNAKQPSAMSRFVSTFKRFCNKEYGENIWQRGSIDHVIRNRDDYQEHIKYISENPTRWHYDELYGE